MKISVINKKVYDQIQRGHRERFNKIRGSSTKNTSTLFRNEQLMQAYKPDLVKQSGLYRDTYMNQLKVKMLNKGRRSKSHQQQY